MHRLSLGATALFGHAAGVDVDGDNLQTKFRMNPMLNQSDQSRTAAQTKKRSVLDRDPFAGKGGGNNGLPPLQGVSPPGPPSPASRKPSPTSPRPDSGKGRRVELAPIVSHTGSFVTPTRPASRPELPFPTSDFKLFMQESGNGHKMEETTGDVRVELATENIVGETGQGSNQVDDLNGAKAKQEFFTGETVVLYGKVGKVLSVDFRENDQWGFETGPRCVVVGFEEDWKPVTSKGPLGKLQQALAYADRPLEQTGSFPYMKFSEKNRTRVTIPWEHRDVLFKIGNRVQVVGCDQQQFNGQHGTIIGVDPDDRERLHVHFDAEVRLNDNKGAYWFLKRQFLKLSDQPQAQRESLQGLPEDVRTEKAASTAEGDLSNAEYGPEGPGYGPIVDI